MLFRIIDVKIFYKKFFLYLLGRFALTYTATFDSC